MAMRAAAALDVRSGQLKDKLEEWLWGMCIARARLSINDATAQARPNAPHSSKGAAHQESPYTGTRLVSTTISRRCAAGLTGRKSRRFASLMWWSPRFCACGVLGEKARPHNACGSRTPQASWNLIVLYSICRQLEPQRS